MKYVFFVIVLTGLMLSSGALQCQPPTYEKYIVSTSGRNVQFTINSINRYSLGHELKDWTRLTINIPPSDLAPSQQWSLFAFSESEHLYGDMYGKLLPVDYISLSATVISGDVIIESGGELTPAQQFLRLASGTGPGTFELLISYSIGKDEDKKLLGEHFDYYFTDIYFQVYTAD